MHLIMFGFEKFGAKKEKTLTPEDEALAKEIEELESVEATGNEVEPELDFGDEDLPMAA